MSSRKGLQGPTFGGSRGFLRADDRSTPPVNNGSSRLQLSNLPGFETINDKVLKELNQRAQTIVSKRKLSGEGDAEADSETKALPARTSSAAAAANAVALVRASPVLSRRSQKSSLAHRRQFMKMDSIASHYKVRGEVMRSTQHTSGRVSQQSHRDDLQHQHQHQHQQQLQQHQPSPLKKRKVETVAPASESDNFKENTGPLNPLVASKSTMCLSGRPPALITPKPKPFAIPKSTSTNSISAISRKPQKPPLSSRPTKPVPSASSTSVGSRPAMSLPQSKSSYCLSPHRMGSSLHDNSSTTSSSSSRLPLPRNLAPGRNASSPLPKSPSLRSLACENSSSRLFAATATSEAKKKPRMLRPAVSSPNLKQHTRRLPSP